MIVFQKSFKQTGVYIRTVDEKREVFSLFTDDIIKEVKTLFTAQFEGFVSEEAYEVVNYFEKYRALIDFCSKNHCLPELLLTEIKRGFSNEVNKDKYMKMICK